MSKAEDKAEDAYLDYFLDGRLRNCSRHEAFIEGYRQAEKDLELTWEDVFGIFCLVNEVLDDYAEGKTKKEVGEEVLKRFNEQRKDEAK